MPVGRRAELSSKAGTSGFRTFLYRHTKTVSQKYPTMPVYPPSLQTPSVERKPPPAFDTTELGQRSPSGAVQNNSYQEEAAIGLLEGLDPWFTNPGGPLELITRLYEESQRHSLSSPDDLELAHSTIHRHDKGRPIYWKSHRSIRFRTIGRHLGVFFNRLRQQMPRSFGAALGTI
ncbi:hypothetical protein LTR41_011232 [Exophiala xenobiotica]|nr:hypothetical protein LTR41_011232 [Exophiala xenobiotica]